MTVLYFSSLVHTFMHLNTLFITSHRYLVSVYRASTGNVHRAVGPDFVLNVGDILYFTGMVNEFGKFCAENGLEVVTSENDATARTDHPAAQSALEDEFKDSEMAGKQVRFDASVMEESESKLKIEGPTSGRMIIDVDVDVMHTSKRRRSILGPETDKLQSINKMTGKFNYRYRTVPLIPLAKQTNSNTQLFLVQTQ